MLLDFVSSDRSSLNTDWCSLILIDADWLVLMLMLMLWPLAVTPVSHVGAYHRPPTVLFNFVSIFVYQSLKKNDWLLCIENLRSLCVVWYWHIGHYSPLPHQYYAVIKNILFTKKKICQIKTLPVRRVVLPQKLHCRAKENEFILWYGVCTSSGYSIVSKRVLKEDIGIV